jgi:hypothetical protein
MSWLWEWNLERYVVSALDALGTKMTDNCAHVMGASGAAEARALAHSTTAIAGPMGGYDTRGDLLYAQFSYDDQNSSISLNSDINWLSPGLALLSDPSSNNFLAEQFGAVDNDGSPEITAPQFFDLMLLHELSHRWNLNNDSVDFDTRLYRNCLDVIRGPDIDIAGNRIL